MHRWLLLLLIVFLITGCAVYSDHYQGRRALGGEKYDEAILLFQKALKASPNNPRILTDLGVAYFRKDDLERAIQYLEKAKSLDPMYGKPYLYLGMVYEKQDDYSKAISEYNAYYQQFPLMPMGRRLKARMGVLMRKQIAKEVQETMRQEKSIFVASIPQNTIAVSYFSNLTDNSEFDPLQKGLADMLITDLSQVESLKVVERTRLQVLMDELKLSTSAIEDSSTVPRLGRLLGARRIVNGGFATPQASFFRIDAVSTNVTTVQTDAQVDVMGEQDRFFLMEKELVFGILDDLNVTLTQEEQDAIQKIPTESFIAFLAYSRGLDYEDRGMYREASREYQKAVQIDPSFSQANEKFQETQILAETSMTGSLQEVAQLEQEIIAEETLAEEASVEELTLSTTTDRLNTIDQNSAGEFVIQTEETPASAPSTTPQGRQNSVMQITVQW